MVRIEKRSGGLEEFDEAKLEASLMKAGASKEHATRIARAIASDVRDGMESGELLMRAASELKRVDPAAAKRYEAYKKH